MSTARMSSAQFTILKSMSQRGLGFHKAVAFNQVMFYSLIRREYISLDPKTEQFSLTELGQQAFHAYSNGSTSDLLVKNNDDSRKERVELKLTGRQLRKALNTAKRLVTKTKVTVAA